MATNSSGDAKSVDGSLWWDPFSSLLTELENISPSADIPPSLVKKLEANNAWFLNTVSLFKPPNSKSREALDSSLVNIGSHQLTVLPEFKDTALEISSALCLDEVQSYLLVKRSNEEGHSPASSHIVHMPIHMVMLQYYIERQCLLKCTRQILMFACEKEFQAIRDVAQKLIVEGLENKLLSLLQDLLSSAYPENMGVDFFTLWAEEILIEDNLVLDILFLAYYESLCTCNGKQWKKLCLVYEGMISGSYNFGKLALSTEAIGSIYHAKVQLLFILIDTLNLGHLLQMIHDDITFRQGMSAFSLTDIQEIDSIISGYNVFESKEAGPLILTWAVFLCLISSLPQREEYSVLLEIDHVGYVRQAFKASPLSYFVEILQSNVLQDTDSNYAHLGPNCCYRSVLRTFMSSFIASYEINVQLEDNNFKLILEILGRIYRGEESLCSQFWDKDSFIDSPIRCLLCSLEAEFPFRTIELVKLLAALCDGTWPAECVYNFLDKSVGLSSLFETNRGDMVDNASQIVETRQPFIVPGIEGLVIPSRTRGHVLKFINGNTALVRWECTQSGVLVLLMRLGQKIYLDGFEEVLVILDLLSRLVTFNSAVCFALMETGKLSYEDSDPVVNVVELICTLVKNVPPNCNGALVMSMGVNILTKMLNCSPSHVSAMALKTNIFDVALNTNPLGVGSNGLSSGSWLLSGRLAKMLLIDCEHNESSYPLAISVLDFTMQLVETGVENDGVLALVVFSLQYVLVNHEYWKYKVKHLRWKVMLKVLEVIKRCTLSTPYSRNLGKVVQDVLYFDSSIHSALLRIVCTTTEALEKLYVSRLYELVEIEGLELAVCSVLDILFTMLSDLSKDMLPGFPVLLQAVLSSTTKPLPVSTAVVSLTSYFRNPEIQVGAARLLSMLFFIADYSQSYTSANACFGLGDKQITEFRNSVDSIIRVESLCTEDLVVSTFQMLTAAAIYQPAFLAAVIASKEKTSTQLDEGNGVKALKEANLVDAVLGYVERSNDLIKSNPKIMFNALNFLKALWQGAVQFADVLEQLKNNENFWKRLSASMLIIGNKQDLPSKSVSGTEVLSSKYGYHCQSNLLEIMAYELFLQKKLLHAAQASELLNNRISNAVGRGKTTEDSTPCLKDVLSTWTDNSVLSNLIKTYTSCEFDNNKYLHSKITAGLFCVHVMGKLKSGDTGSLSVFLIDKLNELFKKLSNLPAYSELSSQYTQRGYSEGKELNSLILSDLYYHLQGELEGRPIDHRPFKELSQCILESNFLRIYKKYDRDLVTQAGDLYFFDCDRLRADIGLDTWEFSNWKASKDVAETMLLHLQDVNSMLLLAKSKRSALEALTTILSLYDKDHLMQSSEQKTTIPVKIPAELILSSVEHICGSLHSTFDSLAPIPDNSDDILAYLVAQAELLLHLIRSISKRLSFSVCLLILKSSASGLKVLNDFRQSATSVTASTKVLLELLLLSVELSCTRSQSVEVTEMESVESHADASHLSLGLLPVLCNCLEPEDHCTLSLTAMDLILKWFLSPSTWFPVVQKHLQLQRLVHYLQDRKSSISVPIILKFFLSLARVRGSAEMLLNAGFFASLRVLFADISDDTSLSLIQKEKSLSNSSDKIKKPQHIWGLGLAVVTAIIQSSGDSSSCRNFADCIMDYLFLEKSYIIYYYLSAPHVPSDVNEKKRPRAQKTETTLSSLKETEHTLVLLCVLSKHWKSWTKATKEMDSMLREKCIHLLAFISRGNQRLRESPNRVAPIFCHPVLKEEFEWYKKPSFVNSKNGWFGLSPLGCGLDPRFSNVSSRNGLAIKDRTSENANQSQTYFSDFTAIQMYRIAFLLLKFLCLQAQGAARRSEEVGFVDVAHFPELPVPDILQGLQDQGIAIVHELCEARKSKQVPSEIQDVCIMLLHITEMALYLEFCVSQICGIRPVLGRVEDFSKEIRLLISATEGQVFLKEAMKSVKDIISFVYPGLLRTEGFL